MKNRFYIAIMLLSIVFSCSSPSEKKDNLPAGHLQGKDIQRKYRANGTLLAEITMKDGKYNGIARNYYENGQVSNEFIYKDGKQNGSCRIFYTDGKLNSTIQFLNGKKEGLHVKYYRNGKVAAEIPYQNGLPQPGLKEYTRDGKLVKNQFTLQVTPMDRMALKNLYTLILSVSNDSKAVKYYKLMKTKEGFSRQRIPTVNGKSSLPYYISAGGFIKEKVYVDAEIETVFGNPNVTRIEYNLKANHRR